MMQVEEKQSKITLLFIIVLSLLLLLNTIARLEYRDIRSIGDYSNYLTFITVFVFSLWAGNKRRRYEEVNILYVYVAIFLLLAVYSVSFLTVSDTGLLDYVELVFLFLFMFGVAKFRWSPSNIRMMGHIFQIAVIFFFFDWIVSGFILFGFKSIYSNENYLAVLLFSLLYFQVASVKYCRKVERNYFIIMILINLLLIFTTSSRAVYIGITVAILAWALMKTKRRLFPWLFYIVLLSNFLFISLYTGLQYTKVGNMLNNLSRELFNKKNLYSGRSDIWRGVIQAIGEKPFFGHGFDTGARNVMDTHSATHNMYLQIMLEFGTVGFITFVIMLACIWHLLMKRLDFFAAKWAACFMLGILVYQMFENTLFQNNYSIATLQWLIIIIGISISLKAVPQLDVRSRVYRNRYR